MAMVSSLLIAWLGDEPERLLERLGAAFPQDTDLAQALLSPLMGNPSSAAASALSPENRQMAQFQVLTDLLCHEAERAPLFLFLEDLHWLDEASRRWLAHLLAALATRDGPPVAVLCEARPEADQVLQELGRGVDLTRINLGPLSSADARAQALDLLGSDGTGPSGLLAAQLVSKAEGNPFFIEEIVRALEGKGVLVRQDGALRLEGAIPEELPGTVMSLVVSRIDDLPIHARKVAQVAAVIGRSFQTSLLARVYPDPDLHDALAKLSSARLILADEVGASYTFHQQVVWEVAYQSLLVKARRELHIMVAEALAAGPGGDRLLPLVAHHWGQAQVPDKAARASLAAAQAARQAFSNQDARKYLQAALDWLAKAGPNPALESEIRLDLAQVATTLGDYDAALEALDALGADGSGGLRMRGEVLERKGDFTGALDAYEKATPLSTGNSLEAARVASGMGAILLRLGRLQAAIGKGKEALKLLEGEGRPAESAFAHSLLGMCHHRMGSWSEALDDHGRALDLRQEAGDLPGMAKSYNNLGIVTNMMGRWPEAQQHYSRALALSGGSAIGAISQWP